MRAVIAGLVGTLIAGAAVAAEDSACAVSGHLVHADFALPRVAAAIAKKQVTIVVMGTGSSILGGPAGAAKAYPARLEEALTHRLSGTAVKVVGRVKARETAAEMEKRLEQVLVDDKPNLVIWQTGTVDAMLGVDQDEFRSALDDGVDTLQAGEADVVFINMQYSPRTDSMIALGAYAESMRFVALQREINLFDRFAIMKHWNELGTFDLYTATKKMDTAERVHDCIGRLLAGLVIEAATLAGSGTVGSESKDLH